jgi:hypothetical protein
MVLPLDGTLRKTASWQNEFSYEYDIVYSIAAITYLEAWLVPILWLLDGSAPAHTLRQKNVLQGHLLDVVLRTGTENVTDVGHRTGTSFWSAAPVVMCSPSAANRADGPSRIQCQEVVAAAGSTSCSVVSLCNPLSFGLK